MFTLAFTPTLSFLDDMMKNVRFFFFKEIGWKVELKDVSWKNAIKSSNLGYQIRKSFEGDKAKLKENSKVQISRLIPADDVPRTSNSLHALLLSLRKSSVLFFITSYAPKDSR
jgi:hypothetical protein